MGFLFSVFFVKILLFFLLTEIFLPYNRGRTSANRKRIHEAPGQIAHNEKLNARFNDV
jgi:hypothetical protein